MADGYDAETSEASEGEGKKPRSAKAWLKDIEKAENYQAEYHKRAKKIVELYTKQGEAEVSANRKYAMLWSNIEVLKDAVYTRPPQPAINRRFMDRDPTGRHVAETMQRSVASVFDRADVHSCLEQVRDDFLLVGRGTAWVRYKPFFEEKTYGEEAVETVVDETLCFDFVHWSDFIHPKCRQWEDLPWLARKVYLDDADGEKRFGEEEWGELKAKLRINQAADHISTIGYSGKARDDKVCVYEIWSRRDQEVLWIAKGHDEVLDRKPPLFNLKNFWPCPKPVYATLPTDKLIPIPDYVYYQDQSEEIDDLTKRISALTDALKLTGFYPAGSEGGVSDAIEQALKPGGDNTVIPIPSWAAFQSGGGGGKLVEWLPVDMVLKVLQGCTELRRQLIDDVYQITGISDVMRGDTEATETLGAQQLKAQWGGVRVRSRQNAMIRFARDMVEIAAEIVAEKFQPETIWRITGLKFPLMEEKQQAQAAMEQAEALAMGPEGVQPGSEAPPPQPVPPEIKRIAEQPAQEEIIELLRDDGMRSYRIDVETDSTIEADEQAEKAARNEFLQVVSGFMKEALPVAQQQPALVPVMGEMLMFSVRGYRAGRQLEDVIQEAVDELSETAKQAAQNPQPDPEMTKVQGELELAERKMQMEGLEKAAKLKMEQAEKIEGRLAEGLPDGLSFMDLTAQLEQAAQTLGETTAALQQNFQQAMEEIRRIAEQQAAPVEVERDADGRVIMVNKGAVSRQVMHGPDGRVLGMQ